MSQTENREEMHSKTRRAGSAIERIFRRPVRKASTSAALLLLVGAMAPALVGTAGCEPTAREKAVAHKKWPRVHLGMTPREVKGILGPPGCYYNATGCGDVKAKFRRAVDGKRACLDWAYLASAFRVVSTAAV
jgi:hypothetical protein